MSLITPDFGLLFWMTLIFAIVFFILAKFGFPMITRMVDERSERISQSIANAREAEQKLATLAEEQEKMIREAREEQNRILKEASETRDSIISQARSQASEEAAKELARAKTEIAAERETALRDIRRQVALLSVEVAGKVVRKSLSDNAEMSALVDRYMDEADRAEMN